MRVFSIALFSGLLLLTFSCLSPEKSEDQAQNVASSNLDSSLVKKSSPIRIPPLTQENARKELLKFGKKHPETLVLLKTRLGDMTIKLYEETPLHRANFIQLVKRGYYEGTVFHRVVKGLIIQGGNLDNPLIRKKKKSVGVYRVPAEFNPQKFYHKRGALASPRRDEENPEKRSNPYEFYIVQGEKLSPQITQALGQQNGLQYLPEQIQTYAQIGGLPHLDSKYTVFGEVIEGLEIIDKIAEVEVDKSDDWPFEDIIIHMEVLE